jgi:hypothetical protein
MPVLGILTCEILELEFACILARHPDFSGITVIEDRYSFGFIEALEAYRVSPNRIPMVRGFSPNHPGRLEIVVRVLELGLHSRKSLLQGALVKAAREMGRCTDAIMLGYGLCGNALHKPDELLADAGVPVFIPMDQDHPADDCVGLIMGGREHYYWEQCRVAGTFFMTPGWTRHWKQVFKRECGGVGVECGRRIYGMANYERSLLIATPVLSENEMRQNIEEFSQLFGLRTEVRQGTMELLENTWKLAKEYLIGEGGRG